MVTADLNPTTYYRQQARTAHQAAARAAAAWATLDPDAIGPTWALLLPTLLDQLITAQTDAATTGATIPQMAGQAATDLDAAAFAGLAADGRPLDTLLRLPAITALQRIRGGARPAAALRAGKLQLVQIIRSEVADAGRTAGHVALTASPQVIGYERIVVLPACTRCIVLAGRLYPWHADFPRHDRCDCEHRAVTRGQWRNERLGNTPEQLLARMTPAQRQRGGLTAAQQKALDEGADLAQLVNTRRRAAGMTTTGERLATTTEGTTSRGLAGQRLGARRDGIRLPGQRYTRARAPRLLPQEIFRQAGTDRDLAIRLLHANGYIL